MVPKTERFEMRLDPAIIERVDTWREKQGDFPSRAEAIRQLVEDGLSINSSENFRPTNSEKLMMWMLSEILMNQKDYESKDTMKLIQEAIYGGHFWALQWEMSGVFHNHVDDRKKLTAVVNILDMWSFIEPAYARFSDAEKDRIETEIGPLGRDPKFIGFDGNNETEYMGIAYFLVNQLGRFTFLKDRDLNSHMPTADRYRRMAAAFDPMRAKLLGRGLTVDEVIELLKLRFQRDL